VSTDIAVIGGGVSGLAAAYELRQRGHRVLVLERQVRTGGNAVSERLGGFLMEHGPTTVNGASPTALAFSGALGLDGQRRDLGAGVRRRYLVRDGRLHGLSTHPLGLVAANYLSAAGRLRMAVETLVGRDRVGEEESVAQFCRRRFGAEFTSRVIEPLVGGLFAGDAERLSVNALFPRLVEMERRHGSITRAALVRRLKGGRMPGRVLFSWRDGVGSLPRALTGALGPAVRTGVTVRRIHRRGDGFGIDVGEEGVIDARAVLLATQPHVAAALLENLDVEAAEAAAAIDAPPLAVVFLGYDRGQIAHPLDGFGFLTPSVEGRSVSGVLFCSTLFQGRAPEAHVALAVYIGGARAPDLALRPTEELADLARRELADLVGARGAPVVVRVRQWPRGLPQYEIGHRQRVDRIAEAARRAPGLFVTGNYISGVSVSACLEQAIASAARIDGTLRPRSMPRVPAAAPEARNLV
jgi:oxygen-dependent protoporphyrinogen oxidase